jgi:hypothetical protein
MIWIMLLGFLLSAPSAYAETMTLSGDRGFGTVEVSGADLYLADPSFVVNVEQTRQNANIGVIVRQSPPNAAWRGGTVVGMGVNRTESWDAIYRRLPGPGNGACLIFQNSPGFVVEGLRCDWTWDGVRPERGNSAWTLRKAWVSNARDDGVENDQCLDLRVEHSLIEEVFVGYSARPGQSGVPCPHKLEVVGSMISLGRHYDDREKAIRPWSNIQNGKVMQSGALWKVRDGGEGMRLLLKDSIVELDHTPGVWASEMSVVPEKAKVLPDSGNNTLVWLGANDLPGLTYETVDGCKVPKEFKVSKSGIFRVKCGAEGRELWAQAKAALLAGINPPPPPPPPSEVTEFLQYLQAETARLQERVDALLKKQQEPDG